MNPGIIFLEMEPNFKPRKRLGRMRRKLRIGIIIPLGEKVADKSKSLTRELKEK